MPKRKPLPTALHSELTEYSYLIRALRTNDTLDVASHIVKPQPCNTEPALQTHTTSDGLNSNDDSSEVEEDSGIDEYIDHSEMPSSMPPSTSQSREASPLMSGQSSSHGTSQHFSLKRKRKSNYSSSSRPRRRDTWTRWPLLLDDVCIPEWSLEDEIELLATNALKNQPHPLHRTVGKLESSVDSADIEKNSTEDDPSTYISHLTEAASNHLSMILALLVAYTPNRPLSQQNRIEPIGWRAVLNVLSSSGNPRVANQKIVRSVRSRMEAIYGQVEESPHEILAAHRTQFSISAKEQLKTKLAGPMESLFTFTLPPAPLATKDPSQVS